MHLKVPEVKKCCFCFPLRRGIIIFAYINIIFTVLAVACLVIRTELQKLSITNDTSLEVATSTVLFSILGMGVILNILLLVAGCQIITSIMLVSILREPSTSSLVTPPKRDMLMLRLYNYYAVATTLAALVPTFMLLSRGMLFEVLTALFAILMQCYVIILVRSEVVKLEHEQILGIEDMQGENQTIVVVPDRVTLL